MLVALVRKMQNYMGILILQVVACAGAVPCYHRDAPKPTRAQGGLQRGSARTGAAAPVGPPRAGAGARPSRHASGDGSLRRPPAHRCTAFLVLL